MKECISRKIKHNVNKGCMGCIIEVLLDGALTLYRCRNKQTPVSLQAGGQYQWLHVAVVSKKYDYINVLVILPAHLIYCKYTHNIKNGCNISELICHVFILTQSNNLWSKTFL